MGPLAALSCRARTRDRMARCSATVLPGALLSAGVRSRTVCGRGAVFRTTARLGESVVAHLSAGHATFVCALSVLPVGSAAAGVRRKRHAAHHDANTPIQSVDCEWLRHPLQRVSERARVFGVFRRLGVAASAADEKALWHRDADLRGERFDSDHLRTLSLRRGCSGGVLDQRRGRRDWSAYSKAAGEPGSGGLGFFFLLFFAALFVVTAFLYGLEALFAALGALGRTFDKFGAHQLELGHFGAIALPPTQANDAAVTAIALSELGSELVEEFLDRRGSP